MKKESKFKDILRIIITISAVMLLCISTFIIMDDGVIWSKIFFSFTINFVLVIFITWFDYICLEKIKMLLPSRPILCFLISILFTSVIVLIFIYLIKILVVPIFLHNIHIRPAKIVIGTFFTNNMIMMLIEMYSAYHMRQDAEKRAIEAEREKAQYQFMALKNQINPHFLFNSMNVLSSLIYKDAERANIFTKKLSAVYRYLLTTNKSPIVSLREELDFVNNFIFLENIRYADGINIEINGNTNLENIFVIPASIQMLVENAIKHNRASVTEPLNISITLNDDNVVVRNDLQPRTDTNSNGIGLKNLQKQYNLQNKDIDIYVSEKEFKVTLPYFHLKNCN